jgi:SAM-dependent methyltransferase
MLLLKEIAQNALMSIAPVRRLAQRWHSTGIKNDPGAARQAFDFLRSAGPVEGRHILEIGPGQTLKVLQYALEAGAASCTAVDIVNYFEDAPPEVLGGVALKIYDGRRLPVEDQSVDLIWSFDTFEHLRYPEITVRECRRVLRPGGRLICEVDIRDHYETDEAKLADNLRYHRWLWNAMTWNRSAFTNRLRYSEWRRLFASAGLTVESCVTRVSDVLQREYARRRDLKRFSMEDVAITSFRAVLERP